MTEQGQDLTAGAPPLKGPGKMRVLDAEVLDGFSIGELKCRSCSGYGNCGYKSYYLNPDGKGVVSICMQHRDHLRRKRDEGKLDES